MLRAYLARGGKLLLLLDPPDRPDSAALTNLVALRPSGASRSANIVVDTSGMGQLLGTDVSVPVAARYENHPITERFNLMTAYPLARSVSILRAAPTGRYAQNLVLTSPRSWAETDIKRLLDSGEVQQEDDKGDVAGPVSLAAAVPRRRPTRPRRPSRDGWRAAGDAADADRRVRRLRLRTNGWLGIPGNRDLFLNTVNWLAQQENLIAIRPRDPEDRRITLTADQEQRIFWLTLFIIPGLILATGVYTWWRRR
jgi:ABC-type uncharacterized transport system involved in gliding motility auxiliary subunit